MGFYGNIPDINKILISKSNDPFLNLALEEYLVRTDSGDTILLLYVNRPTVVVGKHQNLFQETKPSTLKAQGVDLARRISGGGAVFHDPGNLCFGVITPFDASLHNNYRPFLNPIIKTVKRIGLKCQLNDRNSLILEDGRKISGSAQFVSRGRMISHGTLLVSTNLNQLKSSLEPAFDTLETHAVDSVRSSVANISETVGTDVDVWQVGNMVQDEFARDQKPLSPIILDEDTLAAWPIESAKYRSWEWTFGRSPRFTAVILVDGEAVEVTVQNGIVTQANAVSTETVNSIKGVRFESLDIERIDR